MKVVKGKNAYIQFFKEDDYKDFACAESFSLTIDTEMKETKTVGHGNWAEPRPRKKSYSISLSGLAAFDTDQVTHDYLREHQLQDVAIQFRIFYTDESSNIVDMVTGTAFVQNYTADAPIDFVTTTINLVGRGKPEFGVPPSCSAVITAATATRQGDTLLFTINILNVANGPIGRFDWRKTYGIGQESTGTVLGNTFTVNYVPLTGFNTLYIKPVCDNGISGPEYTITINLNDSCAVSITLGQSVTEGSNRRITVTPSATPVYYNWEYVSIENGTHSGMSFTNEWLVTDYGAGTMHINAVCSNGIEGAEFNLNLVDPCDAVIEDYHIDVVGPNAVVVIDSATNAVSFDWEYTPIEGDPQSGNSEENSWVIVHDNGGALDVWPVCESGVRGEVKHMAIFV